MAVHVTAKKEKAVATLWLGTSGYQYKEWKGLFYPQELPANRLFSYYSSQFNSVEINYTFNRMPALSVLEKWKEIAPPRFKFSFKAPKRITHIARLEPWCLDSVKYFCEIVRVLGEPLGPILFQLPSDMIANPQLLSDFCRELPVDVRFAFEFRNETWFSDEIYTILTEFRCALCLAESDILKTPEMSTTDFGYIRFRKSNYSSADWDHWMVMLEKNRPRWKDCFAYFKHEETAKGPAFAREFQTRFEENEK